MFLNNVLLERSLRPKPRSTKNAVLALVVVVLFPLLLLSCTGISTPQGWSGGVVVENVEYQGESYPSVLYIGTMEGDVRALETESGYGLGFGAGIDSREWRFVFRGDGNKRALYGDIAIDGQVMFIAGYDGLLYAVCLDGSPIDEVVVGSGMPMVGSPIVADVDGQTVVMVGSSDGLFYAYDFVEGDPVDECDGPRLIRSWTHETSNKIWSSPIEHNDNVYFGALDHNVYALSGYDGQFMWDSPVSTGGAITSKPIIEGSRLYVGSFDGNFYSIDIRTGSVIDEFKDAKGWFWGNPIARDGVIYAPSLDGNLYALDMGNLTLNWLFKTQGPLVGSPAIIDDRIAIPSTDHYVYLVNLNTGEEDDRCDVGSEIRSSIAVHGDEIYLKTNDHAIRKLVVAKYRNFWRFEEEWKHETDAEGDPVTKWGCGR